VLFFACLALVFLSLFFIINTSYPDLNLTTKPKNSRLKVKGERTGVKLSEKDVTESNLILTGTCPVPPKRDGRGQGAQYKMKLPCREASRCGRRASLMKIIAGFALSKSVICCPLCVF
jgi:hypothetical protein